MDFSLNTRDCFSRIFTSDVFRSHISWLPCFLWTDFHFSLLHLSLSQLFFRIILAYFSWFLFSSHKFLMFSFYELPFFGHYVRISFSHPLDPLFLECFFFFSHGFRDTEEHLHFILICCFSLPVILFMHFWIHRFMIRFRILSPLFDVFQFIRHYTLHQLVLPHTEALFSPPFAFFKYFCSYPSDTLAFSTTALFSF